MKTLLRPWVVVLAMMPLTAVPQSQPADTDDPRAVVRGMIQAWHDLDVDRVIELFAPDGVFHSVMLEPIVGRQALRAHFEPVFAELERVRLRTVNMAVNGNVVFFERVDDFVYRGKHSQIPVAGVIEVADGRIQEWRDYYDRASMVEAMTVD